MSREDSRDVKRNKHFERCYRYVENNIEKLISVYGNKYVLIYQCKVIDSDSDEFELARRAQLRSKLDLELPAASVYIPKTLREYREQHSVKNDPPYLHF